MKIINVLLILSITLCLLTSTFVDAKMLRNVNRGSRSQLKDSSVKTSEKQTFQSKLERLMEARAQQINKKLATPSSYQVLPGTMPGLSPDVNITHYSGYITIDQTTDANLFFWFIQANATNPFDLPLLIWINGGPGCSSMDGLFIENGPFRIQKVADQDYNININPYSWHNSANMLYIDEPVGTGFSYVTDPSGYVRDDSDLELDFFMFLQDFFKIFSEYSTLPLYLSGESYAGHYIPIYANYILQVNEAIANKSIVTDDIILNLQGAAIGNGWTHPITQYDSYNKMGYAAGIISWDQYNAYQPLVQACQQQIANGVYDSDECGNVLDTLSNDSGSNFTTQVNVYDYRLYDSSGGVNWPQGIFDEQDYLSMESVRNACHVYNAPTTWAECNGTASQFLTNTDQSTLELFPYLLSNLRLLVYNGQFDIICNHIGTQEYLNNLQWNGTAGWNAAQRYTWTVDEQTAGYVKSYQNLTFLLVLGGSHMVPMDQPLFTFDMITRFLGNQSYDYDSQTVGVPTAPPKHENISPLSQTAWILIIFAGFAAGLIIGTSIVIFYFRSKFAYTRIVN